MSELKNPKLNKPKNKRLITPRCSMVCLHSKDNIEGIYCERSGDFLDLVEAYWMICDYFKSSDRYKEGDENAT